MARKVRIEIELDVKGGVKGVRTLDGEIKDLNVTAKKTAKTFSTFKKVLGGLALAAIARGAVQVSKRLFEMGSAAEETASKFNTVFGDMADEVDDFGESIANMAGLTQTEFRDLASIAGSILQGMGADMATVVAETERITRLAADLASFHNVSIQEAFTAIRAGITGETEPLKRFGILLDAATTKTEALAASGKKNEKQLTQLEKVQARLNLIWKGAGVAIGDLERTQNSAANTARRLAAEIREQADAFAQKLLPAMQEALSTVDILLSQNEEALESWSDEIAASITEIVGLVSELALATAELKQSSLAVREANPLWDALIETWKKTNILFDVRQQIELVKLGLSLFNEETKEAALNQQLLNMVLTSHVSVVDAAAAADTEAARIAEEAAERIRKAAELLAAQNKGLTGITDTLNEEIRNLTFQVRDLTRADIAETLALMAKVSQLREELRLRRQLLGLAGAPIEGLEEAPELPPAPFSVEPPSVERFQLMGDITDAIHEQTLALQAQEFAEKALQKAAIARAVALGVSQANVLEGILASVRQIIQARLAEAIAGAVASSSILGPIAGAAAGALMAVLFNQLMPSGHKGSSGGAGASARADTTSTQGVALGGIRVQRRGVTVGAQGASASARAQTVTIRVIEPDLFKLNTELSNADGVRTQVGSI